MGNPLNVLYNAVGWVLRQIYSGLSPIFGATSGWTWALTIVLLVAAMRLIMVPLFIKQMHTTRAMTSLQPQMAALRKKYKNDKQTLNQETMKLYQEAGVNPLMGCLPVVAQLPVFFALFSVLRFIAEWHQGQPLKYGFTETMVQSAQHAKILGVNIADKVLFTHGLYVPLHAKIVIFATVVVSMITTFLTVRQSMKRGMMPTATPDNPMGQSQKYMAYIMPFFALTGLYWPFGLVLYWVTTNLWTLGQQWVLFKRYPYTPPSADSAGAPAAAAPALAPKGTSAMRRASTSRSLPGDASKPGQNGTAGASGAPGANGGAGSAGGAGPAAKSANGSAPTARKAAGNGSAGPAKAAAGRPPAGASRPSGARSGASGTAKQAGGKNGAGAASGSAATGATSAATGASGMLRKLGRGRSEPEPQVEEAEVKLVRQQRQRQSRSKRSGKR